VKGIKESLVAQPGRLLIQEHYALLITFLSGPQLNEDTSGGNAKGKREKGEERKGIKNLGTNGRYASVSTHHSKSLREPQKKKQRGWQNPGLQGRDWHENSPIEGNKNRGKV